MQWVAMAAMLIDHIGIVFFPDDVTWRIIGRLAFPIYAYGITQGLSRTRDRRKYLKRLAVLAVISQIPFGLALQLPLINVIASFFIVALAITLSERLQRKSGRLITLVAAATFLQALPFDYGAYGLCLVLIYRHLTGWKMAAAHVVLNVVYVLATGWIVQMVSIIPTLILAATKLNIYSHVPKWLWRAFYPAHLAALYSLTLLI